MTEVRRQKRILVVGGGAREQAIAEALKRSGRATLYVLATNGNPGLLKIADVFDTHDSTDTRWIADWAGNNSIDMAVIGIEDALDAGLPDALVTSGIPTVGPLKVAAQLETSKLFTRELLDRHKIAGQVEYRYFSDALHLRGFLASSAKQFALKPIGLTAGKGVRVMGVHLNSVEEAIEYGEKVIHNQIGGHGGILVEERVSGPEFTLQAFVVGKTLLPMPLVQDFKRAFEGDTGPNTGGMGSYSQSDGLLPFTTREDKDEAVQILTQVVGALCLEGIEYKGILYGQFMVTDRGIKLIEINARFGDPEAMNVLPLLENDFTEVCEAIVSGELDQIELRFSPKATVCKYIAPPGYGVDPKVGSPLRFDIQQIEALGVKVYFAKVDQIDDAIFTTTSRAAALLGIADSIGEAESRVENAIAHVQGEFHVRHDIGKPESLPKFDSLAKRPV